MFLSALLLASILATSKCYFSEENFTEESRMQPPTVVIAIIARNAAHSLPYYLGALERLNYPKDRISIWYVPLPSVTSGSFLLVVVRNPISCSYWLGHKRINCPYIKRHLPLPCLYFRSGGYPSHETVCYVWSYLDVLTLIIYSLKLC